MPIPEQLPEPVRRGIESFAAAARQAFAEDLVAVVLFGSAAEGRLRATSDVNVIVVLAQIDPARLEAIGDAYRLAHAAIRLSAMFILEREIAVASEAFAVKFNDIAARHVVLVGRDPFTELKVSREASVRRLRQVLSNLILRLRERLALSGPYEDELARAAADAVGPLRAAAATLTTLEGGTAAGGREALAALAAAADKAVALAQIVEARERGIVSAAGGGRAALLAAIDLAGFLEARAERLA